MYVVLFVIFCVIKLVYLVVNGYFDLFVEIFNCFFELRKLKIKYIVYILWLSMIFCKGYWEINYFVLLLKLV